MARSVSARIQILLALSYLRHGERDVALEQLSLALTDANEVGDDGAREFILKLVERIRGANSSERGPA
jgi:thioredoxin-like negative regulator of GroEL